jgi:ATP-dependent DNA helicase RecG
MWRYRRKSPCAPARAGGWPRTSPGSLPFVVAQLRLDTPVQFLKGIGEKRAEAFARLGVASVQDLLFHVPHRYIDASSLTPMAKARIGDDVACVGTVISKGVLPTRKGLRIFHAVLRDQSGVLECAWPGQAFLDRVVIPGQLVLVAGPIRFYHGRQMAPRELLVLGDPDDAAIAGRIIPVYPATEGLSHKQIRAIINQHLEAMVAIVPDILPEPLRARFNLPSLAEALHAVHRPISASEAERGRRRLAVDELLDLQLMLARARQVARAGQRGTRFVVHRTLTTQLRERLPWELTSDQKQAIREIFDDMTKAERMHRLVMGDVGTGKTVVALFAMLLALENGFQAALMAPTELLAEQHHQTLSKLVAPLGLVPELLLGRLGAADKRAARARLQDGDTSLVIGTHALVQEEVGFQRLGLVVIDEQHRFGVEQRAALMHKGDAPDVLLLTATPIPRSLALTRFGDLDMSILKTRPPGRGAVRTALRTPSHRNRVFEFVRAAAREGRQAYVVLPVIEESERADLRAAETMATELTARWPEVRVGMVHGRLKAPERDRVMRAFRDGEVQVLVATTVIEVGIDVPNATVLVIEHPERFGLAQLHQLRGRVGRGERESHCILLTASGDVLERLRAFTQTNDGFKIAELDLEERGRGDLLGARQSGGVDFKIARFPEDTDLLGEARALARAVLDADPMLNQRENRPLRERALARYPRGEVLFRVG